MPPVATGDVQLIGAVGVVAGSGLRHTLNSVLRDAAPAPISEPFADVRPTLASEMR